MTTTLYEYLNMSEKTTSVAVSSLGPLGSIFVADFSGEKRVLIDGMTFHVKIYRMITYRSGSTLLVSAS